jgi:catechol 2,3-dioxygenase-like lactoylglutathione lyase family enzyme
MSAIPHVFPLGQVNELAFVVRDLDAAVRSYWEQFGVGPWHIYTYGTPLVKEMTYRGRQQDFRMRLALAWRGSLQLELVQSLEGPNVYEEFLARHGEGMHHVGIFVDDLEAEARKLEAAGYSLIQSGRGYGKLGDGAFAYFETERSLATILELIEVPRERIAPEAVYPAEPGA